MLKLDAMPTDALERLLWLSGVAEQVKTELDAAWRAAYFEARFTGRLEEAERLALHSHKRVMAWTRAENEARGRMIRWGDGR